MTIGFILDCFAGTLGGRAVTYAMGRLATGETFGIVEDRRVPTFFVRARDAAHAAPTTARPTSFATMDGEPVLAVESPDVNALRRLESALRHRGVRTYEGDVDFAHGYLMENHLRGTVSLEGPWRPSDHVNRVYVNPRVTPAEGEPRLRVLSFDIETDVRDERVLAISLVAYGLGEETEEVLVLDEGTPNAPPWFTPCADEASLLAAFAERVRALDPDVVTGWNVAEFDLPTLARRFAKHRVPWLLGRTRTAPAAGKSAVPPLRGRQVLDALRLARVSLHGLDDLRLDTVARQVLGRGKTLDAGATGNAPEAILASYRDDRLGFARYCLEDARLVRDILRQEKLLELTVSRARLIGLPLSKTWGSVAPFEFIYMSELRRRGHVAPSHGVDQPPVHESPGGLVLEPQPGLHAHTLVFDFQSLYPSLIRTFNIDPLAHAQAQRAPDGDLLTAPNGATFVRERGILPATLDRFFASRAAAQRDGDAVASYAYKILMNSFYGVLGTDACRFASPALAGAITSHGHGILRWAKAHFEGQGFTVLYGDTDSLFVDARLPADVSVEDALARGSALAAGLNASLAADIAARHGVESRLTLRFDKYYRWFLLPHSRGGEGRAKSYAGLKRDGAREVVDVVGMEAVRSDWTPLARTLQRELLAMLFAEAPAERIVAHVRALVAAVNRGERDAELVYCKRIRRPLASYTSTTPPHVKAARLLPQAPRAVQYLMTKDGPQPLGHVTAPVDHAHYLTKQILPIVETIALWAGIDAHAACRAPGPRGLFGD